MSKLSHYIYDNFYAKLMKKCIDWFYYLPVKKNKIVMLHDFGLGYGDSPKCIAEALLKQEKKYYIVWLVNNMSLEIPAPIKKVYLARIRSVYELATAKVIITTMKGRVNLKKKKSQFFVYIPHGQSGAKYVEKAAKGLGASYIEGSKWHSSVSDLFLSSSKMQTQEMRDYFWYEEGEILESGLPRNDIFFNYQEKDIKRLRENLGINNNEYVVLYAPTFRNKGGLSVYDIDTHRLREVIRKKTGRECTILIRLHPNYIWYGKPAFVYSDKVKDVTSYPDIQELLLISDLLVSDYSSTMFDFMLMKRPVFLYAKDIEEYQEMRGLKDWFDQIPFPVCHNNDELCQAILEYDEQSHHSRCEGFDNLYGSLEDGFATKRVVEKLESIMDMQ